MSWDMMKKSKEEGGSSKFIKIKDGDAIEGVFRGDPYCFYQKFKDPNEYKTYAAGRSFRFKINFLIKDEEGQYVAKIFQQGSTVRDQLLDAIEEYGLDCVFKIKRTGSGKEDTRYSLLFKSKLSPEQIEKLSLIKLNTLQRQEQEEEPSHTDEERIPDEDDIPFL